MAWNDPNWGKKGNNSGPPDLDELWRRFNEKLAGLFGGKGRGPSMPNGPAGPGAGKNTNPVENSGSATYPSTGVTDIPSKVYSRSCKGLSCTGHLLGHRLVIG